MAEYRWFDKGNGRQVMRKVRETVASNRSSLAAPMVIGSFAEPVQSSADGKYYSTKAGLARSHRASGNPHGIDFIELGNDSMPWVEHKSSETELRDDVRHAVADVAAGKLPDIAYLED